MPSLGTSSSQTFALRKIDGLFVSRKEDPRVTLQLENIDQVYVPVSKYPSMTRDISFIVDETFVLNDYYVQVREVAGDLVEEMSLLDTFRCEKFGPGKVSYTFRMVYRSHERTLTREEVDDVQMAIRAMTEESGAALR